MKTLLALLVLFAFTFGGFPVLAQTWTVEQDGTGDWVSIHAAIQAAASGDTILIGPGVYNQTFADPYGDPVVAYLGDHKDLVISGISKDEVLIGPDVFTVNCTGLYMSTGSTEISNVTFRNCYDALKGTGDWVVNSCEMVESSAGIVSVGAGKVVVFNCVFGPDPQAGRSGAIFVWGANYVLVQDCSMMDCRIYLDGVIDSLIERCSLMHPSTERSISYASSNGTLKGNITNGLLTVGGASSLRFIGNTFQFPPAGTKNVFLQGDGVSVELFDNVFYGGSYSSLNFLSEASVRGSGNHILNGGGHSVRLQYYGQWNNDAIIDLRNNYWGTADSTQISAWIYDDHDTSTIYTEVQFSPFSGQPLPAESETLGGLKSMFR